MKVNHDVKPTRTGQTHAVDKSKEQSSKSKGIEEALSTPGDSLKVNMSSDAQAMQKAKNIAGKDTVDEAKVARLQKLIDEGKYQVDSQAVADRLVDEHLMTGE